MEIFKQLFTKSTKLNVIGMIHLKALPGTPKHQWPLDHIVGEALKEARIYESACVDGVLIENMSDVPYIKGTDLGPEITASMSRVATAVREELPRTIPCGIQVLAGGNKEALAISKACGLQFARCEGFVFSHVADEGWMDGCAGNLLRYRKSIDAEDVLVFADIKKKHSAHTVTSDVTLEETAKAAEFFLADGVILTGTSTGSETDPEEVKSVKTATTCPVLVGSGITLDNVHKFSSADGLIVGSHFKKNGRWDGELDEEKVKLLMEKVEEIRSKIPQH